MQEQVTRFPPSSLQRIEATPTDITYTISTVAEEYCQRQAYKVKDLCPKMISAPTVICRLNSLLKPNGLSDEAFVVNLKLCA